MHLRHTFTIARSSEDVARTLVLHVGADGIDGIGESRRVERYDENAELVRRQLRSSI